MIGALLVAATLPITLRQHVFAPWSLLEPSLLTLALTNVALGERSLMRVLVLTIIASVNRETAC